MINAYPLVNWRAAAAVVLLSFAVVLPMHAATPRWITVAADGSGQFRSIQKAVNSIRSGTAPVIIFIKPGVYHQRVSLPRHLPPVTLLGRDGETRRTIITFALNANHKGADGRPIGTFLTPTVWVRCNNFSAANLTIVNAAGNTGQALALRVDSDRCVFYHCRLIGWQDTLLVAKQRQYFENCTICGATDFIFGAGTDYFNHCLIHCLGYGFVTAARTPKTAANGFVFDHCKILTATRPGRVVLGRPWRQYAHVVFMHTWLGAGISPRAWITWHHNPADKKTVRYAQYANRGPGWNPAKAASWTKILTARQAGGLTVQNVLSGADGWNPRRRVQRKLLPEILKVSGPQIPAQVFAAADYHLKPNSPAMQTHIIQNVLNICRQAGGGEVIIGPGKYFTGPLTIFSHENLHLAKGCTLLFSTDPRDYPHRPDGFVPCLGADHASDIALTGHGVLDGQGLPWWRIAWAAKRHHAVPTPVPVRRPQLIVLNRCRRVLVQDVTLENSPSFHLFPQECRDVVIRGITILAPQHSPNTDGIDPSGWNYLITHCRFNEGDDCIAIKAAGIPRWRHPSCENVLIRDCTFDHGHGMSVGSVTYGGLRNMTVTHCVFNHTDAGIRLKSNRRRGGLVEDLDYSHLTMIDVKMPIQIVSYYLKVPKNAQNDHAFPVTSRTPIWRNITIHDVTADGAAAAGEIIGLPEMPIRNVQLDHVTIEARGGMKIVRGNAIDFTACKIRVAHGPALRVYHSTVQGMSTGH